MRKFILLIAVAAMALTASAQTEKSALSSTSKIYDGYKFTDNWYVGINGGIGGATKDFKANGNIGLRFGKNLTPAIGLGLEGNYYFTNTIKGGFKPSEDGYSQLGIYANLNLMNTFAGYNGEPRPFEVSMLTGFYWGRNWGDYDKSLIAERNIFVHKLAFDFAYNFGNQKEWQVYLEPAWNWAIAGVAGSDSWQVEWNVNRSYVNINAGLIYKLKCSNGKHNFALVTARDEAEIASLNKNINDLRAANNAEVAANASLKKQVADLTSALAACNAKPAVVKTEIEPTLPSIYFPLGKSVIPVSQQQNVQIAGQMLQNHKDWKLVIKGYASPEGNAEANKILSQKRAEAVKAELVKKYHIDPSRITAEGCGVESVFEINDFNRVAMMSTEK